MDLKKALYITQQLSPYVPHSPMADASRDFAQALQEAGIEVRTFMPKYGCINERRNQLHEVIRLSGLNIVIDDNDHPLIIKVATLLPTRMQVYFIDNDDYFRRATTPGLEIDTLPADNDERIMFFARGVIETVRKLRWAPAVIHCNGWASSLAPLYVHRRFADDPALHDAKVVYTVTADVPVNDLDSRMPEKLKMDGFKPRDLHALTQAPQINAMALHKLAIAHSDGVVLAPDVNVEVAAELKQFAADAKKAVLDLTGKAQPTLQNYTEFYASL